MYVNGNNASSVQSPANSPPIKATAPATSTLSPVSQYMPFLYPNTVIMDGIAIISAKTIKIIIPPKADINSVPIKSPFPVFCSMQNQNFLMYDYFVHTEQN